MAARSVHRSHYILRFELFTFLVNSFKSKFHFFFGFACNSFAFLSTANQTARQRPQNGEKQAILNFNFAYNFSVVKYASCIHDAWFCLSSSQTRDLSPTMIYYVKIVSQIESAPISSRNDSIGLNRLDLSVCFMLTEISRIFIPPLNASTFFIHKMDFNTHSSCLCIPKNKFLKFLTDNGKTHDMNFLLIWFLAYLYSFIIVCFSIKSLFADSIKTEYLANFVSLFLYYEHSNASVITWIFVCKSEHRKIKEDCLSLE